MSSAHRPRRADLRDLDGGRDEPSHYSWREVYHALECPQPDVEVVPFDSSGAAAADGGDNGD